MFNDQASDHLLTKSSQPLRMFLLNLIHLDLASVIGTLKLTAIMYFGWHLFKGVVNPVAS